MKPIFRLLLFIVILLPATLGAADQTLTIVRSLKHWGDGPASASLTPAQAESLVKFSLADSHPADDRYYVIHSVKYQESRLSPEEQKWYVFHNDWKADSHSFLYPGEKGYFEDKRILGSKKLAVVYLHILLGIAPESALAKAKELHANDNQTAPTDLNDVQLRGQLSGILSEIERWAPDDLLVTELDRLDTKQRSDLEKLYTRASRQREILMLAKTGSTARYRFVGHNRERLAAISGLIVRGEYEDLEKLAYRVEISLKTPQPFENLQSIADLATGLGAQGVIMDIPMELKPQALVAGAPFETSYIPSEMAITGYYTKQKDGKETEISKMTFLNEGRYWYDFSLALPLESYNEFRFDKATDRITAREINKKNLWALFNAGWPRDLERTHLQYLPVFVYGMPITGQPLKHHLFGGSIGLNKLNFFVGVRLDKKKFLSDPANPNSSEVTERWRTHLAYGINFPVGTIVEALKKKSK